MTISIYRENRDCFVVESNDRSNDAEVRHDIWVLHVICNDPMHGIQYVAGDRFSVMYRKGEGERFKEWDLTPATIQLHHFRIAELDGALTAAVKRAEKGQAFKTFVHTRLDQMGVPKEFPNGEHSKEGCRVGDRLDWIERRRGSITALMDNLSRVESELVTAQGRAEKAEADLAAARAEHKAAIEKIGAAAVYEQDQRRETEKQLAAAQATIADMQAGFDATKEGYNKAQENHAREYHRIALALNCHVRDDFPDKIGALVEHIKALEATIAGQGRGDIPREAPQPFKVQSELPWKLESTDDAIDAVAKAKRQAIRLAALNELDNDHSASISGEQAELIADAITAAIVAGMP